jgi:hypothetical protein
LIRLAHPSATAEIHDKLSYRAFRNALNDHDLEWAIVQSTTESIDEALHLALKYEAYNMSKRKPALRYQSLDDKDQANNRTFMKESRSCFYCQKVGHLAKECNKKAGPTEYHGSKSNAKKILTSNPETVTLLLIMASCLVIGTGETARS